MKSYLNIIRKSDFFITFLVIYSIFKIFLLKDFWIKNNKSLVIFSLNSDRNIQDIEALKTFNDVKIIRFPIEVQQRITAPFLQPLRENIFKEKKWHEVKNNEDVEITKKNLIRYLEKFLSKLRRFIYFDIVMTCSFYYWHDKCWEEASPNIGIPYVVLHKECNKDPSIFKKSIKSYLDRGFKFNGTSIIVYNNLERDCLIESKVCGKDRIRVLGSPRMDRIQNKENKIDYKKEITLFSFRHSFGGLKIDDRKSQVAGFSYSRSEGIINYFINVHGKFARAAIENPDKTFNIKMKWSNGWIDHIYDAITKVNGVHYDKIKNLNFFGKEIDAIDLIKRSEIVIGINTTSLIEAKILGKKVVIPYFNEVKEKYDDYVFFKKYFHKNFQIAESPDQLVKLINDNDFNHNGYSNQLIREYLGFNDSNSTQRVIDFLKTL
tara:strand:- start:16185 stop:17486 length:1302 start_codon:yes stop_codon:yes gene_type:complete